MPRLNDVSLPPGTSASRRARAGFTAAALVCFAAGAGSFERGLAARAALEPPQLVVASVDQLFTRPTTSVPLAAEIRGRALATPSPALAQRGAPWRHLGAGLLAAALGSAFCAQRTAPSANSARARIAGSLAVLWLAPGVVGLLRLIDRAGASAPHVAMARSAFHEALAWIGFALVLTLAWRRRPA